MAHRPGRSRAQGAREGGAPAIDPYHGEVIFVGVTKKRSWFALVYVDPDEGEEALYKAVSGRGKLFTLDGFEPEETR